MSVIVEFMVFLVLLGVYESGSISVHGATSIISVKDGAFKCGSKGNMLCSGNATTTGDGLLKLTPYPLKAHPNAYYQHSVGAALYKDSFQLVNSSTREVASFNVSFSLRIEGDPFGDGMAFVMFGNKAWNGSLEGNLGAFESNGTASSPTLAVEFDTYKNMQDPDVDMDGNHVGIDINSIKSVAAKDVASIGITLVKTPRLFAWVDYDGSTFLLAVRVASAPDRPAEALISVTTDLRNIFSEGSGAVWVGFTGSNGGPNYGVYTGYHLSMRVSNSTEELLTPAPAPAPKALVIPPVDKLASPTISVAVISAIAIFTTVGTIITTLLVYWFYLRRRKESDFDTGGGSIRSVGSQEVNLAGLSLTLKRFTYQELLTATNGFCDERKLGGGGFGNVYRGDFHDHRTLDQQSMAVKKLSADSRQGEKEFIAEVSTISHLRHRNIVQLLGYCSEGPGKLLLVYEYMANSSLDKVLFKEQGEKLLLSWEQRFKILEGVAAGLQYIHYGWQQQVIHRDVKSSNIMLDESYNGLLGDFGLARVADHHRRLATTYAAGTFGYLAPEAISTGRFSIKTDVYAFGAVALEIVCGRKVYDPERGAEKILLVDWVWSKLNEEDVIAVVDETVLGDFNPQEVETVILLALLCSHPNPDERPSMKSVMEILSGSVEMPPIPRQKPVIEYKSNELLYQMPRSGQSSDRSKDGGPKSLNSLASNLSQQEARSSQTSTLTSHTSFGSSLERQILVGQDCNVVYDRQGKLPVPSANKETV